MDDTKLSRLDASEAALIERFKHHPLFAAPMADDLLHRVLLERREVSLIFDEVYARMVVAIDPLSTKNVLRRIIRDEYPAESIAIDGRSHREDLVVDLLHVGVDLQTVNRFEPSAATARILAETKDYVRSILKEPNPSLPCAAFTRFWGEILTSVEYGLLWEAALKQKFEREDASVFYWNHFRYDRKEISFERDYSSDENYADSHSDQLTNEIRHMIRAKQDARLVEGINERAFDLKYEFYTQFL